MNNVRAVILGITLVAIVGAVNGQLSQCTDQKPEVRVVDFEVGSDPVYSHVCEYWGDQLINCMCIEIIKTEEETNGSQR